MALLAAAVILLSSGNVTPDEQTTILAQQVGVDPIELLGASNSTGAAPVAYLMYEGLMEPPPPSRPPSASNSPAPPTSGVSSRVACIEAKESGGANVSNSRGSGAGGVMQYMDSTFARGAREMGHPEWSPWSPWQARRVAAHDLMRGRRAQWTVSGC